MKSTAGKIVGFSLIGIAGADLVLGQTSTPLPILGSFLTPALDAVLAGVGVLILVYF